jgi:hypothetical protein
MFINEYLFSGKWQARRTSTSAKEGFINVVSNNSLFIIFEMLYTINMIDTASIGNILLSKTILFYVFVVFLIAIFIVTSALVFHWIKYSKEMDLKYKIMPIIYIIGVLVFIMVAFSFYLLI